MSAITRRRAGVPQPVPVCRCAATQRVAISNRRLRLVGAGKVRFAYHDYAAHAKDGETDAARPGVPAPLLPYVVSLAEPDVVILIELHAASLAELPAATSAELQIVSLARSVTPSCSRAVSSRRRRLPSLNAVRVAGRR
jgi:hypothetical protein